MREILHQSNICLLREIEKLEAWLAPISPVQELVPYHNWIVGACQLLHGKVLQNLRDLDLGRDEILSDILSTTQELSRMFSLYNQRLLSPVFRSLPSDQLCLRIVSWLHKGHRLTSNIPVGLSDGEFGIWPAPPFPTVYFMPSSAQRGLLYLPLFFHEFGHLLYACHKQQLDTAVRELQEEILDLLTPVSRRNDLYEQTEEGKRSEIAESWYKWAQELFCDAVGLSIGGPSFTRAFSAYFRMLGRSQFHLPREELTNVSHPVSWIRVKLLVERERQLGWSLEANALENEWQTLAKEMVIVEDHYGFYTDRFQPAIQQAIDTMLKEAGPYQITQGEVSCSEWVAGQCTPVCLLNRAWSMFLSDPANYSAWESRAIATFQALGV
jgi:hypothetical protein